eukprot:scaffold1511_cov170-Amphora_coffeaeformis.AAC.10
MLLCTSGRATNQCISVVRVARFRVRSQKNYGTHHHHIILCTIAAVERSPSFILTQQQKKQALFHKTTNRRPAQT